MLGHGRLAKKSGYPFPTFVVLLSTFSVTGDVVLLFGFVESYNETLVVPIGNTNIFDGHFQSFFPTLSGRV